MSLKYHPLRMEFDVSFGDLHPDLGDVIAFAGKQVVSTFIQRYTKCNVSHVGMMLDRKTIIESTQLQGFTGVVIRPLSEALYGYYGNAWWLPLAKDARARLDRESMRRWLVAQEGVPYDVKGAMAAGADLFDKLVAKLPAFVGKYYTFYAQEDLSKLFCSELAAQALQIGKVLRYVNASEVTPIDLCRMKRGNESIYGPMYFQLKQTPEGFQQEIRGI